MRWIDYVLQSFVALFFVIVGSFLLLGNSEFAGSKISVPNMVGMNLQSAQDCLQDDGFTNLRFETGGFHLWDRNYKVVRQEPQTVDSKSDRVTLYATKGIGLGELDCP